MASHGETDELDIKSASSAIPTPISKQIASEIGDFFAWADVAAICYVHLKDVITSEDNFIADYFSGGLYEAEDSPNTGRLENLTQCVKDAVSSEMTHRSTSDSALKSMLEAADTTRLIEFGRKILNRVTLYWAIIRGIDLAYGDYSKFSSIARRGPLNRAKRDEVGVYLASPASALSEALLLANLKRIPELSFNMQLSYIQFYEKARTLNLPKVRLVKYCEGQDIYNLPAIYNQAQLASTARAEMFSAGDQTSDIAVFPKHVRIGLALFSPVQLACIKKDEECCDQRLEPITFVARQGRSLSATYDKNYAKEYKESVTKALDMSIQQGCHILLFPEIVISAELRVIIQEYLRQPDLERRPTLVIAGSSWEPGEVHGNNVSYLFDGYGHEVGRYYKYSPFVKLDGDRQVIFKESFDDPGKECVIVDISMLGRVLPSICKDLVDDRRYTLDLAKCFKPNLVCTPALSSSIDTGFSLPVEVLSERSLAITTVCNLCGYRTGDSKSSTAVSLVGAPLKSAEESSRTRTFDLKLMRDENCREECLARLHKKAPTSCVYVIDIDCMTFGEEGYIASQRIPLQ